MGVDAERRRAETMLFYVALAVLGYLVFRLFQPFLVPLGWATVLVVFCHPLHARLARRIGATWAATISTVAVALGLVLPSVALGFAFAREATNAVTGISAALAAGELESLERVWNWAQTQVFGQQGIDLTTVAKDGGARVAAALASQAGAVVRNVAVFFFDVGVTLFAVFFLFRDSDAVMRWLRRLLPFDDLHRERMLSSARDLIFATVTSGFIVAVIQGLLGGLTFAILGLGAPVFWGVVMGFFSLLPFAGAWIVWIPTAIWLVASGSVVKGLVLVGIGAGVVGLVDNFLRPMLLSGRSQLSGLLVFISLVGGAALFGLLGLVMGPVLLATMAGLLEAYTED